MREQISNIIENEIEKGNNRITIDINLKSLPLENINKVAGPFVEAWALEIFDAILEVDENAFELINVEPGKRLDPYDILLQFKKVGNGDEYITSNVDVKATSEDIPNSGKSPNITSYAVIRTEYIEDPDYIFVVLSLKHKVYSERDKKNKMTHGIMEVVSFSVYDLKYVGSSDMNYNPALGHGQLQIRDIHYVDEEIRTVMDFIELLDRKYIKSHSKDKWIKLALSKGWIKEK